MADRLVAPKRTCKYGACTGVTKKRENCKSCISRGSNGCRWHGDNNRNENNRRRNQERRRRRTSESNLEEEEEDTTEDEHAISGRLDTIAQTVGWLNVKSFESTSSSSSSFYSSADDSLMMSLSEQTSSGGDGAYYQTRFYEPRTRNMPNLTSSPLGGPSSPTPPGHIFSEVELNDAFWTASVNVKMLKDMCVCLASLTPTDDCEYAIVNMQSRSVLFPSARAKRCKSFVHFVETSPDYAPGTWLLCIFDGTFSKTPGENAFEPTLRVFDPYISTFRGTAGASHLIKFYQEMFFPTELARFVLPFQLRSANINNNNQAAAAAAANLLDENAVLTRMRTIFASQQVFPHLKVSRRAKQDSLALSLYAAVSFSSLYLSGRDQITQSDIVDTVSLLTRMMTLLLHAKLRNAKHRDTARRILEDLLLNNDRIDWLQRIL